MNGRARLRAEFPPRAVRELASALHDFDAIMECWPDAVDAVIACQQAILAELKRADPMWGPIREAVRSARRACRGRFRLNFNRLEARLENSFTEHKRKMARR